MLMQHAVETTIDALDLTPKDACAVRLALEYAITIDGCRDPAWAMRWLGPLLLDCLESLGATPLARSRLKGGPASDGKPNQLELLRKARRG
jgi:hypothetical protein